MTVDMKCFLEFSALTQAFYTSFSRGLSEKSKIFQKAFLNPSLKIKDGFLGKNLRDELIVAVLEIGSSGFQDLLSGYFRVADLVNKLFTEFNRYMPLFKVSDQYYESCERHLIFSRCSGQLLQITGLFGAQLSGQHKKSVDKAINEFRESISETNKQIVKELDQRKIEMLAETTEKKDDYQVENKKIAPANIGIITKIFNKIRAFFVGIAKFFARKMGLKTHSVDGSNGQGNKKLSK